MKVKDTDTLRPLLENKVPQEVMDWETQLKVSIAISLKRIADVLDDGLTTMTPDGKSVAGLADIAKSMEMKS